MLYEIHGGFCVEARSTNCGLDIFGAAFSQSSTKDTAEVYFIIEAKNENIIRSIRIPISENVFKFSNNISIF